MILFDCETIKRILKKKRIGCKSTVIHYKTIKFNIKIILNIHNSRKLIHSKFANLRAKRAKNFVIFLTFAPPNPKNGSTPLCLFGINSNEKRSGHHSSDNTIKCASYGHGDRHVSLEEKKK